MQLQSGLCSLGNWSKFTKDRQRNAGMLSGLKKYPDLYLQLQKPVSVTDIFHQYLVRAQKSILTGSFPERKKK